MSSRPFAHASRARLLSAIGLCLGLSVACGLQAADVYTWKDANGVTHYSQTPPPKGTKSQYRMFIHAKREGPKTAESPVTTQCTTARNNIALLESNQSVSRDSDGDGKPDTNLSAGERAQQLELARMVVRANCAKVPATAANAAPPPAPVAPARPQTAATTRETGQEAPQDQESKRDSDGY
jgi:hypothetical protein